MCTKKDISTGQTKHTFYKGYKMEHRVRSFSAPLISLLIGWWTASSS